MSEISFLDKNKSIDKLRNLPPIYYINLDDQTNRRAYMEAQFKYWNIQDYTRISAYDGRESDLGEILVGKYPDNVTSGEIGCVTSHLKAIKHWYDTSDSPYALFLEDDVELSIARFWNFTWTEFFCRVPYNWDCLQLAVICTGDVHVQVHTRFVNDFSTAAYVINRSYAEKLIRLHVRDNKYKLDQGVKPRAVGDDLIYNSGVTYACPLFLYKTELGSSIHEDHVEIFHQTNYQAILHFWKTQGFQMEVSQITDFNPYVGRVSENSSQNNSTE
jgi:hypothetical protein